MLLFSKKTTCAMCGETFKDKEMFALETDSPLLKDINPSGVVKLCNRCNWRYNHIYKENYKKEDVKQAWKTFGAAENSLLCATNNDLIRNFRILMKEKMGGFANYNAFQDAMNALYSEESAGMVTGYFAVNEKKGCFSIIRNDHIGVPRKAGDLADAALVEDGDEAYVKKCELIFTYKDPEKKPDAITMFSTTGIARTSTIYKESMDTYHQIMELVERIRG